MFDTSVHLKKNVKVILRSKQYMQMQDIFDRSFHFFFFFIIIRFDARSFYSVIIFHDTSVPPPPAERKNEREEDEKYQRGARRHPRSDHDSFFTRSTIFQSAN